jgi:hypothetical protein
MPFYEIGYPSVAAAAAAAYSTFKGDVAVSSFVREAGSFTNAATASSIILGRPGNTPVDTGTTVLNAVQADTQEATLARIASTWSTAPTVPTIVFRRINLPATAGSGIVWVWNPGEEIFTSKTAGPANWLVYWNFGAAAGSVLNQYLKISE